GEAGGSLAGVFERLADFERTRDDLRSYIVSSMVYPALLATVGTSSIIFLLTFVIPRFASIFEESHMKMPLPTMLMLEASHLATTYGPFALLLAVGGFIGMQMYVRSVEGRLWWDTF